MLDSGSDFPLVDRLWRLKGIPELLIAFALDFMEPDVEDLLLVVKLPSLIDELLEPVFIYVSIENEKWTPSVSLAEEVHVFDITYRSN